MANTDVFEKYFQIADTDKDGRISGQEAVAFFRLSGLPQMTLAKVWQYADQRQAGFLLRPDFFNALKLVTVAQTGRDLTPEVVRAALTGPAASQIPPPQISGSRPPPPTAQPTSNLSSPPAPGYGVQVPGGARGPPGQSPPGMFAPQFAPQQSSIAGQFPAAGQPGGMPQGQVPPGQGAPPARTASQGFGAQFPPVAPQEPAPPPNPTAQQQQQQRQFSQSQAPSRQILQTSSWTSSGGPQPGQPPQPQPRLQAGFPAPAGAPAPAVEAHNPGPQKAAQGGFADFGSFNLSHQGAPQVSSGPVPGSAPGPAPAKPLGSTGSPVGQQGPLSAGKGPLPEDLFGADAFSAGGGPPPPPSGQAKGVPEPSFLFATPVSAPQQPGYQQPLGGAPLGAPQQMQLGLPGAGPSGSFDPRTPAVPPAAVPPPVVPGPQPQQGDGRQEGGRVGGPPGSPQWPTMSVQDAQRYTQIFAQVDTDRDHKITGGEARNLFLSFGLQREILKKIWDLSDQDKDGMLSHREFCTAMYLIERFREGRTMPGTLPPGIHMDDAAAGQPGPPPATRADIAAARMAEAQAAVAQNNKPAPWRLDPSMLVSKSTAQLASQQQQQQQGQGPVQTAVGQMPVSAADASAATTGPLAYRSKAPPLELHKVRQLDKDEQDNVQKKHKEAEEADRKVWSTDAELLDSKQKIEFYRTKMQEIIMFKSRCDNRLNETTERAAAEKREVAELAKKYDEKYKQTEGVANRLLQEETGLRDLQEKKAELHKAVTRLMEGGPPSGFLQEKADKLASELEDLRKLVNKRAKQLGLKVRPILGSDEVPFGWQPGLQENAVEWDDEWHEFDDEGFATVEDIGDDVGPVTVAFDDDDPFAPSSNIPLEIVKAQEPKPEPKPEPEPEAEEENSEITHVGKDTGVDKPLPIESRKGERYAGVADSQDFGDQGGGEQQPSYSSGNSTSFTGHAESSAADTFGDGGPTWSTFGGQRLPNDDEADSGVRASWGLQSNPPSTQVSTDFGRDSTTFNRSFVDFGDNGRFDTHHKEDDSDEEMQNGNRKKDREDEDEDESEDEGRNGNGKKEREEEDEEDNDPFTALFKKRAASYTSLMNWDKSVDSTSTFDQSAFGSFGDDRGGFVSRGDESRESEKPKEDSVKASQSWSAF